MRVCVLACLTGLLAVSAAAAQPAGPEGRLRVVGRAAVEVPPDYASVRIGVATRAATAAAALAENSASARRAVDLAKGSGIADRDIQTGAVTLSQAYKTVPNPGGGATQQPDGYQTTNSVVVRVRAIDALGEFLRKVVETGANRVDGVSFGLNDPDRVLADAQVAAVKDAVGRAGRMAEAAGVSLGRIERIDAPPRAAERAPIMPPQPLMRSMAAAPVAVPIEAGSLDTTAEVEVTFRLVQP